jgi:hypothetical protein
MGRRYPRGRPDRTRAALAVVAITPPPPGAGAVERPAPAAGGYSRWCARRIASGAPARSSSLQSSFTS